MRVPQEASVLIEIFTIQKILSGSYGTQLGLLCGSLFIPGTADECDSLEVAQRAVRGAEGTISIALRRVAAKDLKDAAALAFLAGQVPQFITHPGAEIAQEDARPRFDQPA